MRGDAPARQGQGATALRLAVFAATFVGLQSLWSTARGTVVERTLIDSLIVPVAAWWVNVIWPSVQASAQGARLVSPAGGINVLNGCEGTDVLFLLMAALAVAPLSWRARLAGMAIGALLVFALNQLRIVVLFQSVRLEPEWFAALHAVVTPLALTLAVALFFLAWMRRHAAFPWASA